MLVNLKTVLQAAEEGKFAVGAFNTPNLESVVAVLRVAEKLKLPVVLQHAEVHEKVIPIATIGPIMIEFAKKTSVPVCMQLDHGETDLCFLPHLAGTGTPQMDTEDKGIIYGLTLDTTRGELVKAALEGIACDMRLNIRSMEACGLEVKHITGAGGGARSLKGVQVRCDMMGRPVLVARDEQAGARGVFYIMARALGWIRDYGQIAGPPEGTWIYPQKDAEQAEKKFRMYQSLYQKTRDIRKEQRRSGI